MEASMFKTVTELKQKLERERPPIALMNEGGKVIERPTNLNILNEIDLVVIPQIRVCYDLVMNEGDFVDLGAVGNVLFVVMGRLDCLLNYISRGVHHVDE